MNVKLLLDILPYAVRDQSHTVVRDKITAGELARLDPVLKQSQWATVPQCQGCREFLSLLNSDIGSTNKITAREIMTFMMIPSKTMKNGSANPNDTRFEKQSKIPSSDLTSDVSKGTSSTNCYICMNAHSRPVNSSL
jgi:hypothetical protein